MHFRRLAALALGAWLGGSLLVFFFTVQSTEITDRILRAPAREAVDVVAKLQEAEVRMLLSYRATEANLWLTSTWEIAQLMLGILALLALIMSATGSRYPIVVCLLMIASVIFLHWFLTPKIESLSRSVVFVRVDQVSVVRDRLRSLQTGYSIAESLKMALGLVMAFGLLKRVRRRHHEAEID